ncbi:hypothetical protein CcarbDRAFT_5048 [Clostridium carboxidivorans P7]|uniref:Uncharacterized protein n=1 Tax=Clostridium carboxidivorans P7 TaxID=536227 RepID=C6Q1Y0_9CLOT|nr:hypothetical protein CcarbDRAFT_5048 [Clostridium carboxidivorans P7]
MSSLPILLENKLYIPTNNNSVRTIILRYFASIISTVFTPKTAPITVKGSKNFKIFKSTFPDCINLRELVNDAQVEENLLVPRVI